MIAIFVHGWSVRGTGTYGRLPERLAALGGIDVRHIYLGQYVSYRDEVTMEDIALTFDAAVRQRVPPGERFACITHSTGGPVVRTWLDLCYGPARLRECPLSHLVMLAPANHGSALAQLGKSRLSRMKFFLEGVEPGQHVLDWLELGSAGQWALNTAALDYRYVDNGVFPFVLTGQSIDRKMYDHLNSYTGEPGSDGVVRAAAANLNYSYVALEQDAGGALTLTRAVRSPGVAFGILPGLSHSGEAMGIMNSVQDAGSHATVDWVARCLAVQDAGGYARVAADMDLLTAATQDRESATARHSMFTFHLRDRRGAPLEDYDLLFLGGPGYDPDELPAGFFRDRQRNSVDRGRLTYYVNHDRLTAPGADGRIGLRVLARPDAGLARYAAGELRSDGTHIGQWLRANETTMVEVTLSRSVEPAVFQMLDAPGPPAPGR